MASFDQCHHQGYSIAQGLPAEILVHIVAFYQDNIRADEFPYDPWSFLVFTRVCRLWREVIYSTKLLWTTIYLPAHDPLLSLALLHSAHLPLDFTVSDGGAVAKPDSWLAIAGQAHRIRRLAVKITEHTETCEIPPSAVPVAAPHLASIVIREADGWHALPRFFLKSISAAPQLQHLDVIAYPGFWTDLARFTALKRLTVRRGAVPRQQSEVALVDVKAGLVALTQLEELDAFCNIAEEGREECHPVVALPHLRTLNFTGPVWCTAAVLNALEFPRSVRVVADQVEILPHDRSFLAAFAGLLLGECEDQLLGGERISSLSFRDEGYCVMVKAFTHESSEAGPRFSLKLGDVDMFTEMLPLEDAVSLSVSGAHKTGGTAIREAICGSLGHIRELRLHDCDLDWLEATVRDAPGSFPNLCTLQLVDMAFTDACGCHGWAENCAHKLERVLAMRWKATGGLLPELQLARCTVSEDDRGLLRPLVQVLSETMDA